MAKFSEKIELGLKNRNAVSSSSVMISVLGVNGYSVNQKNILDYILELVSDLIFYGLFAQFTISGKNVSFQTYLEMHFMLQNLIS